MKERSPAAFRREAVGYVDGETVEGSEAALHPLLLDLAHGAGCSCAESSVSELCTVTDALAGQEGVQS